MHIEHIEGTIADAKRLLQDAREVSTGMNAMQLHAEAQAMLLGAILRELAALRVITEVAIEDT